METLELTRLDELLISGNIQRHADEIDAILSEMEDIPDEIANRIKTLVQTEAYAYWRRNHSTGLVAAATGVGKSKIAIMAAEDIAKVNKACKILVAVPTEKLRDVNWEDEFRKWGLIRLYNKSVTRTCHVSMNKIHDEDFDLVILDEAHNITEANSTFFKQNRVKSCIALTATPPADSMKKQYLAECNLPTIYSLSLDTAIKLRLVSPYEITVIETRLESNKKTVPGGNKDNPFMNTEKNQYEYLTKTISSLMFNKNRTPQQAAALQFKILNRMHFIYGLESKLEAAKLVLDTILKDTTERTLIFCSNIKQAEALSENTFHSKSKSDKAFDDFKAGRINQMACVRSVNEGHNIPVKVDNALIVQLNSKDLDLIQRMGRILRYKKGHIGKIVIIVCVDTVDENWANKALTGFDPTKITRVRVSNIAA